MSAWPPLPYDDWKDTHYALHRWTQIVGKIRMTNTPLMNHSWNSTLRVTPRGLTTGTIPSGEPGTAAWDTARGEFLLPYDAVRTSTDPAATLLSFLESTYAASADLAGWDRPLLEGGVVCDCDPIPATLRRHHRRAP